MIFAKYKNLYFVGIGGAGMSGMAKILHNLGYNVSGSDNTPSEVTAALESAGITVYSSHIGQQVEGADLVVISSAVTEENPEVVAARAAGIPIIKRAEMLGELMRLKFSIGVAGTHGKTTTTAMIGKIMTVAKLDPTVLIGGRAVEDDFGGMLGKGELMVAEADEFDRSFLKMFPSIAVITNIEEDHLDCYNGLDDLLDSFGQYLSRVPFYGSAVIPAHDRNVTRIRDAIKRPVITFGFEPTADVQAVNIAFVGYGSRFDVMVKGERMGQLSLRIPGKYNIANALAATAAALELDVAWEYIEEALREFRGVGRRFQILGEVKGITVADDYAHHPSEVSAVLGGIKSSRGQSGRTIAIFQPHLFTRTRDFYRQFAEALSKADIALIADIYPAREKPLAGVTSEMIVEYAISIGHKNFRYVGLKENAIGAALELAGEGDIIITLGAGDIFRINDKILQELNK